MKHTTRSTRTYAFDMRRTSATTSTTTQLLQRVYLTASPSPSPPVYSGFLYFLSPYPRDTLDALLYVAVFERSCSSPCSTQSFAWKAVLVFLVLIVLHCVLVHEDERSTRPLCIIYVCLSLIIFTLCLILCCLSLSLSLSESIRLAINNR